jgi:ABC-type Fe3+/spermidine/putrescine transport system ATPase subunit
MTFLKIRELSRQYSAKDKAISNLSFEIPKGKTYALVGASGSGKSTLLKIIAGFEYQDAGTVQLGEVMMINRKEKLIPGNEGIQLVHQGFLLYPNSTVEENISRPLLGFEKNYQKQRINSTLKLLELLPHKDKFPKQLSGGQQQKVAIGRALSSEPELLLMDEPFSNLDAPQRRELLGQLKIIFKKLGLTVLFVTHDLDDALQMTEDIMIIQKGKLIQKGTAQHVFRNPVNQYVAQLFSHLNPIPDLKGGFIRPSDLKILKRNGLRGEVLERQFLLHHNLLTVLLAESKQIWKVEDQTRRFDKGDTVCLKYRLENILKF